MCLTTFQDLQSSVMLTPLPPSATLNQAGAAVSELLPEVQQASNSWAHSAQRLSVFLADKAFTRHSPSAGEEDTKMWASRMVT